MKKHQGFLSIELSAGIFVILATMAWGLYWLRTASDRDLNQVTAKHAQSVLSAAMQYESSNYAAILAAANPNVQYSLSVLSAYLPSGFSSNNPYEQTYALYFHKLSATQLQGLVCTTGGETIDEGNVRRIADAIGGDGGYVTASNTAQATGAYSGWTMPFSTFGVTSPGAGKVCMSLFMQDAAASNDYLYRDAQSGHPELNQMNTALDMKGNSINNANEVNASSVAATGAVTAGSVTATNTVAGQNLQVNGTATAGAACSPNGLVAQDGTGVLLSCQSGVWQAIDSSGGGYHYTIGTFNGQFCFNGCTPNPKTGGYNCPPGYSAIGGMTGQAYSWSQWDTTIYFYECIR